VATSVLEHAALLAVRTKDQAAFERNMAQLQQLYASPGPESPLMYEMLGLNLLRLLAADKMAEFHTQVEVVPQARRGDKHIQYPISMEQCMMEGTYHKVIAAAGRAPSPWCAFFAHLLAETVRLQVAESFASAYTSLTPANAIALLMLSNPADLLHFEKQFGWKRSPSGLLVFGGKNGSDARVPKVQVMEQTLSLAEELERIV
jgi:26S proteasome regulatory subunit N12